VTANASAAILCEGQSTTLTGGGATMYVWSGGVSNGVSFVPSTTTTYTVTGTASGCSSTATQTITVNAIPSVTANASAAILCEGQSTTLTGGGAATYAWSGGVSNGISFAPLTTETYTVTGTASGCSSTATQTITVNAIPSVTANASAAFLCEGQSTTLNGGGAAMYAWSGAVSDGIAFTPASSATYTVTGTSSGCSGTATVFITVNPQPVVVATANDSSLCEGQAVVLTGSGADAYTWSGGVTDGISFTPSSTNSYTVTGTAAGCSAAASVTVTVSPAVAANAGMNDSICYGGSAVLQASPSGSAYSYSWSSAATLNDPAISNPSANPAATTTYTVTVTDMNGCSGNDSVILWVDPALTLSSLSANASCNAVCDGSVTVSPSGGTSSYLYSWSNGDTTASSPGLCAGSYTVQVTDTFGCSATQSFSISESPAVDVSVTQNMDTLIANASAASYQWIDCDQSGLAIAGATTQSFVAPASGNYAVVVTQGASCSDTSMCYNVLITGIREDIQTGINVYPNPSTGIIHFKTGNETATVEIYNAIGQMILSKEITGNEQWINAEDQANGWYMIRLTLKDRVVLRQLELAR
jgi:hypothetical protein